MWVCESICCVGSPSGRRTDKVCFAGCSNYTTSFVLALQVLPKSRARTYLRRASFPASSRTQQFHVQRAVTPPSRHRQDYRFFFFCWMLPATSTLAEQQLSPLSFLFFCLRTPRCGVALFQQKLFLSSSILLLLSFAVLAHFLPVGQLPRCISYSLRRKGRCSLKRKNETKGGKRLQRRRARVL